MEDEEEKRGPGRPKKNYALPNQKPRHTFMPPDSMGKVNRHPNNPWNWSLDELIEYRSLGVSPKRIINVDILYMLGKAGVTLSSAAALFEMADTHIIGDPDLHAAFNKGKAELGSRVRAVLVTEALENGNIQAQIHLDKQLNGENKQQSINFNISTTEKLESISTEKLLEVAFNEIEDDKTN